jgi:hypothetical protein
MRQVQNSEYCRVIVRIRERTVPLANFDLIDRLGVLLGLRVLDRKRGIRQPRAPIELPRTTIAR